MTKKITPHPSHILACERLFSEGHPVYLILRKLSEQLKITPEHAQTILKAMEEKWAAALPQSTATKAQLALEALRSHYTVLMQSGEYREATKCLVHIARILGVYQPDVHVAVHNNLPAVESTAIRNRMDDLLLKHKDALQQRLGTLEGKGEGSN